MKLIKFRVINFRSISDSDEVDLASDITALAGLVIVAISVNIARIISVPHLPPRAAATIGALDADCP